MSQIKVYKTDVDEAAAELILKNIQSHFKDYDASFDLEDCDNVLRVESFNGPIDESALKNIFDKYGHSIEQMPLH